MTTPIAKPAPIRRGNRPSQVVGRLRRHGYPIFCAADVLDEIVDYSEENLQREAELKLEAEQAERAAEDARLRELYPLPEDDQEYLEEYEGEVLSDNQQLENIQDSEISSREERKR